MGSHEGRTDIPSVNDASFDIATALLDLSLGDNTPNGASTQEKEPKTPEEQQAADDFTFRHEAPVSTQEESTARVKAAEQSCLVILQDACYNHKFSRNIRQKDLETIVERPERTRAAILGIMNAKSHLDLASLPSLEIIHSSRRGNLGDRAVEAVHGFIYPQRLLEMAKKVEEKLSRGELEISPELPYGDLYLAPRSLEALNGCIGAVYDGMDALFDGEGLLDPGEQSREASQGYRQVHVCVRPPGHHAAETSPCGFCWINNVHVAIAYARERFGVKRAAIFDFDLHHGDGSQSIAWTLNETTPNAIGYYSLHDIYSYPCETGNIEKIREASISISAHGHNIHNEILVPYNDLLDFENIYDKKYSRVFAAAEKYLADGLAKGERSVVCISAGYDASEYESSSMQRHSVSVPTMFYERFTRDACQLAEKYCDGKVFSVMEGGYGDRAITSASTAHILGLVPQADHASPLAHCYSLDRMKLIEKHFPGKNKNSRKSGKVEAETDLWLLNMRDLHEKHLPARHDENAIHKAPEEHANLLDLQRMTLRDRKPRSTPVATPRASKSTPRSTPARRQEKLLDSVRKPREPIPPLPVPAATTQFVPLHNPAMAEIDSLEHSPSSRETDQPSATLDLPEESDPLPEAVDIYTFPG